MKTPDLTPAQVLSWITMICTMLVDATVIDGNTQKLLIGAAGILVPMAWTLADAMIRRGRAHALAAAHLAGKTAAQATAAFGGATLPMEGLGGPRVVVREDTTTGHDPEA